MHLRRLSCTTTNDARTFGRHGRIDVVSGVSSIISLINAGGTRQASGTAPRFFQALARRDER